METSSNSESSNSDQRLAMERALFVLHSGIAHVIASPCLEVGAWQVAFATGAPICLGQSMSSKAAELQVSAATISNGATSFCRAVSIGPSSYMHSESARHNHRQAIYLN